MSHIPIRDAVTVIKTALAEDPDYAWSWHCNLMMPIFEASGCSPARAEEAAAFLLFHLFDCDTTKHPNYKGEKSGAQQYAEMRIAAERAEQLAPLTIETFSKVDGWHEVDHKSLPLKCRGAGRDAKDISSAVTVFFSRRLSDDELRRLHDVCQIWAEQCDD